MKKFLIGVLFLSLISVSFSYETVKYRFDDGTYSRDVVVTKSPERAVTLAQFMTETLLALDLGDKMAGTALMNEEILPEYKEAYDKIPVLEMGEGHSVSKEAFIATGADFVSGWEQSITEESTGSLEELEKRGVVPFVSNGLRNDATIETVYDDFRLLGKIFDVPENAEKVIAKMQNTVKPIAEKTKNIPESSRPKVLIYDSGDSEAFVGGAGLPTDLVRLAGGKNIFSDLDVDYGLVSFESILDRNPDIIVVTEYASGLPVDKKIEVFKNIPGMSTLDAVKNNRIYVVNLAELAPGVRNADTVVKLYNMFYGK